MVSQERPKPKRRPYVKVGSPPRASFSSVAKRINSSKEFAGALLVAEWTLCLACIAFF